MTHICVSKLTIIGSDNGLSPGRRQAIIWTNAGILLIRTLGTNFSEILSGIHVFSFKKMHFKMSSAKWRPFCLGLNVLKLSFWCIIFYLRHCNSPEDRERVRSTTGRNFQMVCRKYMKRYQSTQKYHQTTWISKHMPNKVWDENNDPFPNWRKGRGIHD